MALHIRQQIILAAKARLTGLATCGARVYEGAADSRPASDAPYLLVYGRPEVSQSITMGRPATRLLRELTLAVEAVTAEKGADAGDALMNQIALEVEQALAGEPTLGGLARDLVLVRTDPNARAEGEHRTGRIRLEFVVTYFTAANAPDRSI